MQSVSNYGNIQPALGVNVMDLSVQRSTTDFKLFF